MTASQQALNYATNSLGSELSHQHFWLPSLEHLSFVSTAL